MDSKNPVVQSAQFIYQNSKDVWIPEDGLSKAATAIYQSMKKKNYGIANWKMHSLHPKSANSHAIDWIFLVDLLNFSFFSDFDTSDITTPHPDRYAVEFDNTKWTGYWSLCACINRAIKQGIPITNPQYYGYDASDEELLSIFRSDTKECIPMLEERIYIMREAGQVLVNKFDGSFLNCVKQAQKSVIQLLNIITMNLESFRDEKVYLGRTVRFNKRAQILIADIWACFEGQGFGEFTDIDMLTMFADYRVPQALYHLGALEYSEELLSILRNHVPLPSGSRLEIEIRGCSIWSVQLLLERIRALRDSDEDEQAKGMQVNAILLDFYVWDYAKENQETLRVVPIHRTRSIYY